MLCLPCRSMVVIAQPHSSSMLAPDDVQLTARIFPLLHHSILTSSSYFSNPSST